MKGKRFFVTMFVLAVATGAIAQDYFADVDTLVQRMRNEKGKTDYALLAVQFNNLAQTQPKRWEANYYMAYCKIMQAFNEKEDNIDALLDDAEPVIAKLKKANPAESEFVVLDAFLNQARLTVSPMIRGMKYSQIYNQLLDKAIAMNPENPRAYLVKGLGVIHMPSMFGGGKANAKVFFEKAKVKFASYKAPSSVYPSWGKVLNDSMLAKCSME